MVTLAREYTAETRAPFRPSDRSITGLCEQGESMISEQRQQVEGRSNMLTNVVFCRFSKCDASILEECNAEARLGVGFCGRLHGPVRGHSSPVHKLGSKRTNHPSTDELKCF
ncbi:hypothetical protein J6590_043990 [Homalodisca vitripennis]|nr:hypothetical protein J6590_043990 [Homalodisca vitripennis]